MDYCWDNSSHSGISKVGVSTDACKNNVNSQPQKFTESVLYFLSKQLNSGIIGALQGSHGETIVYWNLSMGFLPHVNSAI